MNFATLCTVNLPLLCYHFKNQFDFSKQRIVFRLIVFHFFVLLMKLYSDNLVDIVFGEGPLGFRIGESDYGNAIVAGFTEREDEPPFPLQV